MEALMFVSANIMVAMVLIWAVLRDSKGDDSGATGLFAFRETGKNKSPPLKSADESMSMKSSPNWVGSRKKDKREEVARNNRTRLGG